MIYSETSTSALLTTPKAVSDQISHQSCPTLCDPMNRSMPGLPVRHHNKDGQGYRWGQMERHSSVFLCFASLLVDFTFSYCQRAFLPHKEYEESSSAITHSQVFQQRGIRSLNSLQPEWMFPAIGSSEVSLVPGPVDQAIEVEER